MALLFDGTDDESDHGDVGGIDGAAALSGACWVLPVALDTSDAFIAKISGTSVAFLFGTHHVTNTQVNVWFDNVPTLGRTGAVLTVDVWTHLGFIFDGSAADNAGRLRILVNGELPNLALVFEGTVPATLVDAGAGGVKLARNTLNSKYANCRLANVKLWAAALTIGEMANEVYSYRPERTNDLILWVPADDDVRAHDFSGRGGHGTVTGAVQVPGPALPFGALE